MTNDQASQKKAIALYIVQQAVRVLGTWTGSSLNFDDANLSPESHTAVTKANELLSWPQSNTSLQPLRVLFDQVQLTQCPLRKYYWKAEAIADSDPPIPYPQPTPPTEVELNDFKLKIQKELRQLNASDWQNLSLLTLILEKFTSHLSFGEEDVALIDFTRATAAVAVALANNPDTTHLSLVAGNLSGIQPFIYTISSDGALKSLRARSFYLELVTEEVVQQLLEDLQLPRTNVIYAGGGNLYLLVGDETEKVEVAVNTIRTRFNEWLKRSFQGKVFLNLDYVSFPTEAVRTKALKTQVNFVEAWEKINKKLAEQKLRKFENKINDFIKISRSYEPCRVCHRDDLPSLKPLNFLEPNSSPACWTCRNMFDLGNHLFKVNAIVRSKRSNIKGASDRLYISGFYYYLFEQSEQASVVKGDTTFFLLNNWKVDKYRPSNTVFLLLGNYGRLTQIPGESGFMPAAEMAKEAKGIERVGYLQMDVDNLGQIFARGLRERTLPRIAGLSRLMSYFFKAYLNSLAKSRDENFSKLRETVKVLENAQCLSESKRLNLLFIYAGGDDLFVSGAWNEVVEFGFDVYQCFRAYSGHHPDITLSGGISIAGAKFPLYQAAVHSKEAEKAAKGNGRNSLGLFEQVFKWDEWLGTADLEVIDSEILEYLHPETKPDLFGIFPFVKQLEQQLEINYSRGFVYNLLATAKLQEQMLKKAKDQPEKQQRDIRYFLHLPKIAYTLTRLPNHVLNNPEFEPVRISLKSPYNAPYFRAIATWIDLLNRSQNHATTTQSTKSIIRAESAKSPRTD